MKVIDVKLSDADIVYLQDYVSKGVHSARSICRARVLLALHAGKSATEAAAYAGVSSGTVSNLRQRYQELGGAVAELLIERPRSGQPPKITPQLEAHITALACSQAPDGRSQWSLRLLSEKVVELGHVDSLSHEAVRRCLKKVNSSPGRSGSGALAR